MSIFTGVFLVMLGLKLAGPVGLSWLVVFTPVIIGFSLVFLVVLLK